MSDEVMLGARIDPDLKRLIDADPRSNQDVVAAALWDEFGGHRKSGLEIRIEHKEDRIQQIQSEIHDLEEELAEVREEKASLERRLEEMDDADEAYEDDIDRILDEAEAGDRETLIIPATLDSVAERHGMKPEQVHTDIKTRAVEQERTLRTHWFVAPMDERDTPDGYITDVWGGDSTDE